MSTDGVATVTLIVVDGVGERRSGVIEAFHPLGVPRDH